MASQDGSIDDGFGGRTTVAADGKTFLSDTPCASGGGGVGGKNNITGAHGGAENPNFVQILAVLQ